MSLRCRHCQRGLTFKRAEEHPPICVIRTALPKGEQELYYCGHCFYEERHEPEGREHYFILLGDSRETQRFELLTLATA